MPSITLTDSRSAIDGWHSRSHDCSNAGSLYEVGHPEQLAAHIDWWIEHPRELNEWGQTYADHTKEHYSVESSVHQFVQMERETIAAHGATR